MEETKQVNLLNSDIINVIMLACLRTFTPPVLLKIKSILRYIRYAILEKDEEDTEDH